MQTMILETILALGLCLAAVMIFAVSDLYNEARQRRLQRQPARPHGAGVRFGGVIQQLSMRKSCWGGSGLLGH